MNEPPKHRRRWFQYSLRSLLIVVAVLALLLGLGRCGYLWMFGEHHVTSLDCGEGRWIVITAAKSPTGPPADYDYRGPYIGTMACYYQVLVEGETIVPKRDFYFTPISKKELLRFRLVSADGGELVGVVFDPGGRHEYLAIVHDFRTGESWRRHYDMPGDLTRLQNALDRLLSENPDLRDPP